MAKARKLKSGNWNIQILDYVDESGKRHVASFTAPTKAEVEYMAAKHKKERPAKDKRQKQDITVEEAIKKYISISQVLSPTTLHAYDRIQRYAFPDIMQKPVSRLDSLQMQEAINKECLRPLTSDPSKTVSAKTVVNEWGLLAAALKSVCGASYSIKLPKKQRHIRELPDPAAVMQAIAGDPIELPCLLAMWLSFSMSEIRGLRCSDINGGYITINRVIVDIGAEHIAKDNAKVETRLRRHRLPGYIQDLIFRTDAWKAYTKDREDRYLIPFTRSGLYSRWKTICSHNGFDMAFHDLRHMNASIMLMLNVPEKYAMERGGWKSPNVMKEVYQHTLSKEREKVDDLIDDFFESILPQ